MPELPEVETVVRGLRPVWEGHRFTRVEARRPDLRRAFPEDLGQRLTGARVEAVRRRAKYGLVDTDRGDTMIFHLGMSGRMRLDPSEIEKHDHVLFTTDNGHIVAFNDARRFGSLDFARTDALDTHPALVALGPEPLDGGLTGAHLAQVFAGRSAPVKAILLDQRAVAGLGNIYVLEALHMTKISPRRLGKDVTKRESAKLAEAIRAVLERAIEAGGSTLRDHAQVDGELGYFQHRFAVYGREGQPCACGKPIERIVQSGRSSFFCPKCQR